MKKNTVLTCAFVLLMCLSSLAYADGSVRKVRTGFFAYPGYHEINNGVRSGYGYDFLQLLGRYTNLHYDCVGYESSWEDMQQMLLDGSIDMVTSARKTSAREELFDFSEPIGTNSAQINVRFDDGRFIPGEYKSLNGIIIGELSGNSRNADVAAFANEKGFRYKIREYETAEELQDALQKGEVDAIATSSLRKSIGEKTVAEFAPQDFFCIVRKGDGDLLDEINYGINQMDVNEGNWRDNLFYKNYSTTPDTYLSFSPRELEYIRAVQDGRKTITVTVQPDKDPYSFLVDGELAGIIPDYFAHLMEMAGLPYSTVVAKSRDEYQEWVSTNHTDVILDMRFTDAPFEGQVWGLLTDPFMQLTTALVTRNDFTGQIRTIATIDSHNSTFIEEGVVADPEYIIFPTRRDTMIAVSEGKADACFVFTYMADKFINKDIDSNLQYKVLKDPVYDNMIYVSPNTDHELCSILNKCIKTDASGILDEYITKYTSVTYDDLTPFQYLRLHPLLILYPVILLLVAVVIVASVHFRSRLVRLRSAQLEEKLKQQRELEDALSMAQSANRAKTTFLNSMSHDIRTPMNAIIGYTGLAAKHIDQKEQVQDYLDKIHQSGEHLLSLINDVLDMSRIESGKMHIEEKPENLGAIVDGIESIVSEDMRLRGHRLSVDMSGVKNVRIICDRLRLNQILLNIISNANKYTPDGGSISLHVTQTAAAHADKAIYEFRVTDTGMGMSSEFLKTVFEPFTRAESSTVSGIQGTGLGMAITKNLVDMMGGTIDVKSKEGKGTEVTMSFEFKLQDDASDSSAASAVSEGLDTTVILSGKKVLLVEDNQYNREIATELLEEYGIIVDHAADGSIAVEKIRNAKTGDYDIVLMDIQMPVMDGYEATRQIRALGSEISKVPIIAMTANAFEEDRQLALEAGMNEHIPKPIDFNRLAALLTEHLK